MRLFFTKRSKKKSRKSVFGGEVRSDAEIKALGKKIAHHESVQGKKAEDRLEQELRDLP